MNRLFSVFCIILCMILSGCSIPSGGTPDETTVAPTTPDTLTYAIGEMRLTLPYASVKTEPGNGFTARFWADETAVSVGRYDKSEYESGTTLWHVAQGAKLAVISRIPSSVKQEDGLTYFEYKVEDEANHETYCIMESFLESERAFWQIAFTCYERDYEEKFEKFMEWTKGVTFEE